MTLVSDIIRDAFRESNINAIGVSPTAAQADEALRLLLRLLSGSYGNQAGENFINIDVGSQGITRPQGYPWISQSELESWFLPEDVRLMLNLTSPFTAYLPPSPDDGARFAIIDVAGNLSTNPITVAGNGRNIEGGTSLTVSVSGYNAEWFYRADIGNWSKVTPLALTDEWPFPLDFDDFFVIGLAMRLNPRNGAAIDPQSLQAYKTTKTSFAARYAQHKTMPSELALLAANGERRLIGYSGTMATSMFNSGYPYNTYWNF